MNLTPVQWWEVIRAFQHFGKPPARDAAEMRARFFTELRSLGAISQLTAEERQVVMTEIEDVLDIEPPGR